VEQITTSGRILVLDGDMIPALTIIRSLSRQGITTDIASHEKAPLTGYSRHAKRKLHYPDPLTEEADFTAWCEKQMRDDDYVLIIPVTERTLVPLQQLRDRPGTDKLAMATNEALAVALDKSRTLELATTLGIPAPRSQLVASRQQLAQIREELQTPVVIKPASSFGSNQDGRKQLQVEYAYSERELSGKAEHLLNYGPVLLQEYIPGDGVGVELIADQGEIAYAFQHLRLHEVPLSGGGSSLRVSVPVEPALLDASQKLMRALKWHGVAMVEFKRDPESGKFALMEINGRFWGSLPLAVAAGADFPAMLYELQCQGGIKPHAPYASDIYCRKLSSDIYWYEQILRRDFPPGFKEIPDGRAIRRDLLRVFSSRHHFDVQQWRDPLPGLIDIGRIIGNYFSRIKGLIIERRALQARRQAWHNGHARRQLHQARQVLFLCYGNINRSALAERYFNTLVPQTELGIISAGFHHEEGRPADPVMVEVADEAGIDMSNWTSRLVTPEMIDESDIILVMEQRHYDRLTADYPGAAEKTFLLGMATADAVPGGEIADPYGLSRDAYERCVRQVTTSVDEVAKLIEAPIKPEQEQPEAQGLK
jgi:protein-tyrosine-phosphatase/predicted ATP-grasp superfamily ATP-dependent carboligase